MKKNLYKKFVVSFLILVFVTQFYSTVENAFAVTDNVVVNLTVTSGISITANTTPVTLLPALSIANESAYGRSSFTVITNDPDGYTLGVLATTDPALKQGVVDSFADYTEAVAGVPEVWSVASGAKEFGFSVYGADEVAGYGTGTCDASGVITGTLNFEGFSTLNNEIATNPDVTLPAGTETFVCFQVQQNDVFAAEGAYSATITGTATVL
ncbi:hypothetical protein CO033_03145 [Candidatus Nomurabacteria bacterium CG_4_9_14_0_2_um_filter_32_10]|uniref:Uncharacterized protein n=3 Tax=Candidatus Nomuraibacteriota TaxID=1752729 RepID=A0A2H0CGX3_9BACT|nr:MAG: hypothetical protein COW91_00635 [Candidatus Nomurabacteria bacterium CG22_combo_CG10-13_8_21_14_all_32_8]PIZ85714.1 MAG: hypothetical protein COX94_02185 [Candidatus Nomurabacteria bacterium CG_4_10_14_0_2_um_filter_33_9]PJC49138.1 MAG: hypothetical protein CO033_03145 [Candidatus Nomurabacteria bacterium CG_4_9_14_0_2_um_filter_32_10]